MCLLLRGRVCAGSAPSAARIYICKPGAPPAPGAGKITDAVSSQQCSQTMRNTRSLRGCGVGSLPVFNCRSRRTKSARCMAEPAARPEAPRPPVPSLSPDAVVRGVETVSSQTATSRSAEEGVTRGSSSRKGCKSLSCGCY